MRNERFPDSFYLNLHQNLINLLHRVGGNSYPLKNGNYRTMYNNAKILPTGYDLVTGGRTYEFGKSLQNLIYGMFCRLFVS